MNVLELKSVVKTFGGITAVDNVSLEIQKGEMFALVGPDGAGKTTLIRMLCGIVTPTSGEVNVLGFDATKQAREVRKRIGYLSQKFSLYGDLTIDENIEFFAEIHGVYDYKQRRNELLEFTRLTGFRTRLAEKLSGGMKQKLALACTLVHTPEIIFLDEPTTGVDPVSRRDFWKVLLSLLKSGITIVMTTPYLDEAERCTRVALMNNGSIMRMGTPLDLKKTMPGQIVEIVCDRVRDGFMILKNHPSVKEVQAFGDRLNVFVDSFTDDMPPIDSALQSGGIAVTGRRVIPPSLENIFVSLVEQDEGHEALPAPGER